MIVKGSRRAAQRSYGVQDRSLRVTMVRIVPFILVLAVTVFLRGSRTSAFAMGDDGDGAQGGAPVRIAVIAVVLVFHGSHFVAGQWRVTSCAHVTRQVLVTGELGLASSCRRRALLVLAPTWLRNGSWRPMKCRWAS